nr:MYXO-CTERM sorting domain-containing protein [Pseudenhygromyxa sp. WMMC2535]
MSEEEFDSGVRDDELADLLLDACLAYSELYGYDWDECEEKRAESEWWLWYKVWWDHEVIDFAYDGSSCEPEEEEEGCAVTRESGPGGVLALGLLLLGLRRRE